MKKGKLGLAAILLPLLLIIFTLFVYSPVTVYVGNPSEYGFTVWDFLPHMLLMGLGGAVVATAIYLVLRGKARIAWAAFAFAVGVALFLQGNFMNADYGVLDGRGVKWDQYTTYAIVNTVVWVALICAAVVLALLKGELMKKVVCFGSVLLVAYEAVMLVMMVFSMPVELEPVEFSVTANYKNRLSSNDNTIIFLCDACDTNYFQQILDEDPQVLDEWDGFVYYPDFVGSFSKTRMSVPYILTGKWYENQMPIQDFIDTAYEDDPLIDELAAADYEIDLYTHREFMNEGLVGTVSNLVATRLIVADHFGLARQWLKLACFNYGPHILKRYFEFYSGDFGLYYGTESGDPANHADNYEFAALAQGDFELTDRNMFKFYHIRGSHLPCNMDADGNFVGDWKSTAYEQTKGVFKYLTIFMNKMKDMGIYDDATIIVMADHGRFDEGLAYPTFAIKRPGAHGAVEVNTTCASQTELHATILQCAGLPVPEGQTSIFDLDPEADYERRYLYYPTSHYNAGYLPDLTEYTISKGLVAKKTGRVFTREGVVEAN